MERHTKLPRPYAIAAREYTFLAYTVTLRLQDNYWSNNASGIALSSCGTCRKTKDEGMSVTLEYHLCFRSASVRTRIRYLGAL